MSERTLLEWAAAGEWSALWADLRALPAGRRRVAVRMREVDGDTALHYVCRGVFESEAERARLARALIAAGADVNAWSAEIVPPIAAAAYAGALPTVRALHAAGARLAVERRAGVPLLYVIADAWARAGANEAETSRAAAEAQALRDRLLGVARYLLRQGVDVNARTAQYRQTALFGAVDRGAGPVIALLLKATDIDLDARDHLGLTVLHYAAHSGDRALARRLLKSGARPDPQDRYGFTPLHEAAANGHVALAQDLIRAGASQTKRLRVAFGPYPKGATPLDVARLREADVA
ncbi:MAG: ankyrin repeat domain-containing protein [Anaerolineales bacterium]|nr:ankyrin repeat domain-containing protein [Anaerolineales bacterium]